MTIAVRICEPPLDNPHLSLRSAHYRLYLNRDGLPVVICVQDFDYADYDAERFLTSDAFDDKRDAETALHDLVTQRTQAEAFDPQQARRLSRVIAVTRVQAIDAALAG